MLNLIEVKNLKKIFIKKTKGNNLKEKIFKKKEEFIAVNDINFKIKKGEIVAFVGPNGARKIYNNQNANWYYSSYFTVKLM